MVYLREISGFVVLNVKKMYIGHIGRNVEIVGLSVEITDKPAIFFALSKKILTTGF